MGLPDAVDPGRRAVLDRQVLILLQLEDRLGRALRRLGAKIRTNGDPVEIDLTFTRAGQVGGFEGWRADATEEEVSDGLKVAVASLDDIIDSKRAANRPKDQMALPYLEALRDEIRRG